MYQDMDRSFNALDTAASGRTINRTPQVVAFSDINYKRDQAATGVGQAKDDLEVAGVKLKAMAVAISKIKSPELKIEKDLEYAKVLTDYKKKQFDVETAMVNQLKQKYEEIKSAVAEIGTLRGGIAAAQVDGVKQRADRQLENDRFKAVGNTGEVNSIESARAAVAQAKTLSANLPKAMESANVAARNQQDLYIKYVASLPEANPERNAAAARISKQSTNINTIREEIFSGGKTGTGVMASDFDEFMNKFSIAINSFKSNPATTDKSVGEITLSIGNQKGSKAIKFSGNQQELELTKDLLENYRKPLKDKNDNETNRVGAENSLKNAIRTIVEKSRVTKANIAKTELDGNLSAISYRDELAAGQIQFDAELKLVKSKAPDAKNYIEAIRLKTEIEDEIKQRQSGSGDNRAAKNKLDIDQIKAEFAAKSATDPLDVANNREMYDDKLKSKLKQIKEEEFAANKKLIAAMNSQVISYLSITDANKNVFKQLTASLLSVQMAGIALLKSYGVLAGEVSMVSFSKNDRGQYQATSDRFNADDSGKLASVKAGQEVDTQNDAIDEFKKSTTALTSANTPEALAQVIAAAKNLNDPDVTAKANNIETALKNGTPFDSAQISDWIKLLTEASDNLVRISDAKKAEVMRNAQIMENSKLAADVSSLSSEINQQYIKNRQTAFRHGSVESTGDIRDMDDKTTQMYSDRIDANRYATMLAVMKEGGESTIRGRMELGRGRNKEEEIQNEYADLPLYGKQFSSAILDAVSSAAKFSTVMREAIEKGSWGEAFSSMMRNMLNKLSDTYSDRASKQIGDLIGGGIDSLFGLNKVLTGGGGQTLGNAGLGGLFGGGGGGGLDIGLGSLLGFSQGSIPSLAKGDYPNGIPGTAYPRTPVQDPREPFESRLAVINSNELVLSAAQVEGYQSYKNDIANSSVVNNNQNSRSTVNNYRNTNVSMNNADTFGQSEYSIKQGMRSRFDKK